MRILDMGVPPQVVLIQPYLEGIPFPRQSHFTSDVYEKYRIKEATNVHKPLIDYYKSKLVDLGYEEIKDVGDYESTEPIMRNTRQAPLYRLLFASKHKRGHDFWKEVIRKNVAGQTSFW